MISSAMAVVAKSVIAVVKMIFLFMLGSPVGCYCFDIHRPPRPEQSLPMSRRLIGEVMAPRARAGTPDDAAVKFVAAWMQAQAALALPFTIRCSGP